MAPSWTCLDPRPGADPHLGPRSPGLSWHNGDMVCAAPGFHTSLTGQASLWLLLVMGLLLIGLFTLDLDGDGADPVTGSLSGSEQPTLPGVLVAMPDQGETGSPEASGDQTEASSHREAARQREASGVSCVGRVVESTNSRPVAQARVVLTRGEKSSETVTDEAGRFTVFWSLDDGDEVDGIEGASPDLEVTAAGFVPLRRTPFDPVPLANGERIYAMTRSARILGRLLAADEVAGTEVILWFCVGFDARRDGDREAVAVEVERVVVGQQGLFAFDGVVPGMYTLGARVPGSGLLMEPGVLVQAGEEQYVNLVALPGGVIRGRVTRGREREAVAGASVRRTPQVRGAGDVAEEAGVDEVETDADGRFLFEGVGVGNHSLLARAPWGNGEMAWVRLEESGGQVEVELVVASAGSLSGSVVDERSHPLGGVRVLLLSEKTGTVSSLLELVQGSTRDVRVTETDSLGRFRFEQLRSYLRLTPVVVDGGGRALLMGETLRVKAGEEREGLVLKLRGQMSLWGKVTDSDQVPLAGAKVTLNYEGRGWNHPYQSALTDGEGAYQLEGVPLDSGSLRVEVAGYEASRERFQMAPDGERLEVNVVMEKSSSVRGVVVDDEGNSLGHGRVVLKWDRWGGGTASLDGWGRFAFQDPGLGTCTLKAEVFGWEQEQTLSVDVYPGQDSVVTIYMSAAPSLERSSLRGRAVIAGATAPVEGLWLRGLRGGTLLVDGGEFTVRGMAPGEVQLTMGGLGAQRFTTEAFQLSPGVERDMGTVELPPGTDLRVRVVDERGQGVRRPKVKLTPLGARGSDPPPKGDRRRTETSSGRSYERRFRGLGQGRWEVKASAEGYIPSKVILRAQKAKQTRVVTLVKIG